MTSYSNTFAGGTNGNTITAANSGGASGDAFSTVTQGNGVTYDNTHVYGTSPLACKIATGGAISCDVWQPASAFSNGNAWLLIFIPTGTTIASNFTILGYYSGSTVRVRVSISTTLKLVVNSTAGGTATSVASVPTNQFFLVEAPAVLAGGTGGSISVKLYNTPTDVSPAETVSQSGVNYGGTADRIRLGVGTLPGVSSPDFWIGWAQANDTGAAIGPVPASTPANVSPPAGAATAAATVPVVSAAASVAPPAGAATGAATNPAVSAAASLSPPAGASTAAATAPTVTTAAGVAPPAGAAVASATSPTVSAGSTVTPPAAAAVADATAPAISYGVTVSPPAGAATGDAASPAVSAGVTVTVPSCAAIGTATPPAITVTVTLDVPAGTATADATSPTVSGACTVLVPSGEAIADATPPVVTYIVARDITVFTGPTVTAYASGPTAGSGYTVGPTTTGYRVGPAAGPNYHPGPVTVGYRSGATAH